MHWELRPRLFRCRLLRRRDSHAQYRPSRQERSALYAVLLHGAFMSHAGQPDDGSVCPPGRHRRHVRGPRSRTQTGRSVSPEACRLSGLSQPELRNDRRGAEERGLSYLHGRQVSTASWPGPAAICGPTAAAGSRSTTPNCRLRRRRIIRRMLSPTMPSSSSTATRATASPISSTWPITLPTGRSMPNRRTSTSFSASTTRVGRRSVRLVSAVRPNWASWTIRGSSPSGSRAAGRI